MCPADPKELPKKALAQIRKLCAGNGAESDSIQIQKAGGETIKMEAITHIEIESKINAEKKTGKQTIGTIVPNGDALPSLTKDYITKLIKNNDARKIIIDKIMMRPDKGFSLHGENIDLPEFTQHYTVHSPCASCNGAAKVNCSRCNGNRQTPCPQCHARTLIPCRKCSGTGTIIGPNNRQLQCTLCFGRKQVGCPLCQKRGVVNCTLCRASGAIACNTCKGLGISSLITTLKLSIKTLFEMDKASLPHQILGILEKSGTKLASSGHIDLTAVAVRREDDGMAIHYHAEFPYGNIVFTVNGKPLDALLFGNKALLLKIKPFLETLITPGITHLKKAAAGEGVISSGIKKSSQYKIIARALLLTSTNPKKKSFIDLKRHYPIGITDKALQHIITLSDQALGNITRKPRYIGLAVGLAVIAIFYMGLFLSPAYLTISTVFPIPFIEEILALLLVGAGGFLTSLIIQKAGSNAMNNAIGHLMAENTKMIAPAKARTSGIYAYVGALILFIVTIELARQMAMPVPSWYPLPPLSKIL